MNETTTMTGVQATVESSPTITDSHAASGSPSTLRMSYAEYLEWAHEDGLTEWVDGEVIVAMPPKEYHQRLVLFLAFLLEGFVKIEQLGRVIVAPFTMRALPDGAAREPDLFFLSTKHLERLTAQELRGPADLVVEVVSDDSVARDRANKFYEYQEAGVREYWIIDPRPGKERVDFYVLDGQGKYQPVLVAADGTYHATVLPGFWLRITWLWAEATNPLTALAEIVGVDQVMAALQDNR